MTVTSKGHAGSLRSATGEQHARILGIGGYRPRRIVPNSEIVDRIDSSDEWIRERSGIIERRWAGEGESVIDMSVLASTPAMEMAGVEAADLDAVILATVSWPYQTPAAAPLVAEALGSKAAAFDISAACAGYCHGLALASDMVRGGSAATSSSSASSGCPTSRAATTAAPPSSSATAPVRPSSARPRPPASVPPSGAPTARSGGRSRRPRAGSTSTSRSSTGRTSGWRARPCSAGPCGAWRPSRSGPSTPRASPSTSSTPSSRTRPTCGSSTRWPSSSSSPRASPSPATSHYTGNTSAASVPLAMERMVRKGEIPSGGLALQIGFGAGLSFAAQVVVIP